MKTLIYKTQCFILTSAFITNSSFASVSSDVRSPNSFAPQKLNALSQPMTFNKEDILSDYKNKIAEDFKISESFKPRVSFWFDVYTKYSAQEEVIHHAEYPWIVFRIVDLRPLLNAEGNRWVNYHKSVKYSKSQLLEVKKTLKSLSLKKNFNNLTEIEKEFFDKLSEVPGKRKFVFQKALANLRTQVGQKDYIEEGLSKSSLYLSKLEELFSANNLPLELTRLPFVESSFNTQAVSKVGASGIWQVMPYIGKKLLVINPHIDERNSPVKSAKAAAYILKENKMILKNWALALTAYNHGAGSLQRAIKQTGSRNLEVLIKKYNEKSFGFASQNFFASFLAILHAEKYRNETFKLIEPLPSLEFSEVRLTKKVRIKDLLKTSELSLEDFQRLNLDIKITAYKQNAFLPKGFVVHLPKTAAQTVTAKGSKIAALLLESASHQKIKL